VREVLTWLERRTNGKLSLADVMASFDRQVAHFTDLHGRVTERQEQEIKLLRSLTETMVSVHQDLNTLGKDFQREITILNEDFTRRNILLTDIATDNRQSLLLITSILEKTAWTRLKKR
jgi:hypothetical protein